MNKLIDLLEGKGRLTNRDILLFLRFATRGAPERFLSIACFSESFLTTSFVVQHFSAGADRKAYFEPYCSCKCPEQLKCADDSKDTLEHSNYT